jgi:hypothetical protein
MLNLLLSILLKAAFQLNIKLSATERTNVLHKELK